MIEVQKEIRTTFNEHKDIIKCEICHKNKESVSYIETDFINIKISNYFSLCKDCLQPYRESLVTLILSWFHSIYDSGLENHINKRNEIWRKNLQ